MTVMTTVIVLTVNMETTQQISVKKVVVFFHLVFFLCQVLSAESGFAYCTESVLRTADGHLVLSCIPPENRICMTQFGERIHVCSSCICSMALTGNCYSKAESGGVEEVRGKCTLRGHGQELVWKR